MNYNNRNIISKFTMFIQDYVAPKLRTALQKLYGPGADPGFQVRGGALKKIAPSGGRRENFWGHEIPQKFSRIPPQLEKI
jgi:hypothetical protein